MIVTDNPRMDFLREKAARLTLSPGVYFMKDKNGAVIYIGKAKSLRKRVQSYFRENADHLPKVAKMVSLVWDFDFLVTASEFEALVLECSQIKQNRPKYNILLKDDKGYSYIRISGGEYPRITAALQKYNDGAEYIGPYTSSYAVRQAVAEANKVFGLPTCNRRFPQEFGKSRPCLNYFIKQCGGLCRGNIPAAEYRETIKLAVEYIRSGSEASVERLRTAMETAAENLDFELAAKLRDRILSIQKAAESQQVIDETIRDCDVFAVAQNGSNAAASVLMYRGGRLSDKADFAIGEEFEPAAMREELLLQYYTAREEIPREIYLDEPPENPMLIEQFLREKCAHAVRLNIPQRGAGLRLVMLAKANAGEHLSLRVGRTGKEILALEQLGKALGLEKPPVYIESYDISNLGSADMVAGMVVFENGRPRRSAYKKFTIKTVAEQNDYACMQEVLERRFRRFLDGDKDEGFARKPDLILLDGGKGHVSAVREVLERLGVTVPLFGLVKDNRHRTRAVATDGGEIMLSQKSAAFRLMTAIQDEVHRYAITFQSARHKKSTYQLELTKIRGIGDKKAQKLLLHFKTKEALKAATAEELAAVVGVNAETAAALYAQIQEHL